MFSGDRKGARACVLCSLYLAKGTHGEGDQEEASWTSPGAPSMAGDAWTRLCCHSEHVGDSGAHVPAFCMLGKQCLCQKPRRDGSQSRHRTLEELWSPRATPGAVGRGPPRAVLRMRQSAEQEASRAASLPPGRRGNGLAGGGAAPRRLLFLPLPVPCGHVAMATELLSSAASRLRWRA